MSEHADRELVELARRGDAPAIAELFSRYWRAARAAAFGVTGEFASAEDAAAEAFRQALVGLDSLQDPDRFGSWLRTIVVRKARLERQSPHPTLDAVSDELSDQNDRPDTALERLEVGAVIQLAVRELPDRLREAIALFYFEGYDSEGAARFLDIPPGTLRRRLHDGRRQLRGVVEQILQGSKRMNEERERKIERVKSAIDDGEIYQALRESLALRPPPNELISLFIRRQQASANDSQAVAGGKASEAAPQTGEHADTGRLRLASGSVFLPGSAGRENLTHLVGSSAVKFSREFIREIAQRFARPSDRASDPNHPVGSIASAIRKLLPDFQDWPLNAGEAAVHFLTFTGEHRDRLRAVLPPGFAEGRPGAFLRATRALVHASETGPVRSTYQLLQDSPDEKTFAVAMKASRISDVLDLTWMVAGPLELRAVQELLERLSSALLPGAQMRFSAYDEPRYRSALQLQVGDIATRSAHGGVLAEWPGRPQGVDAAHLRIFLEPWATVQSGQVVEFNQLPNMPSTLR